MVDWFDAASPSRIEQANARFPNYCLSLVRYSTLKSPSFMLWQSLVETLMSAGWSGGHDVWTCHIISTEKGVQYMDNDTAQGVVGGCIYLGK